MESGCCHRHVRVGGYLEVLVSINRQAGIDMNIFIVSRGWFQNGENNNRFWRGGVPFLTLFFMLTIVYPPLSLAEVHEYVSMYNTFYIEKEEIQDGKRIVNFRYMLNDARMSSIDLEKPGYQVLPYTRYLFAPAFINPEPGNALLIGLGAGAFNRLFNQAFPEAILTSVEIDPMVLRLAKKHTFFAESNNNIVTIEDGRRYLRTSSTKWDWIVLDAFNRKLSIPVHFTTKEFFELVSSHLTHDGAVVVNLGRVTAFFDSHVKTLKAVFPVVDLIPVPGGRGHIIAIASWDTTWDLHRGLHKIPEEVKRVMGENGVDYDEMALQSRQGQLMKISAEAPVMTDDFAPADILILQKR